MTNYLSAKNEALACGENRRKTLISQKPQTDYFWGWQRLSRSNSSATCRQTSLYLHIVILHIKTVRTEIKFSLLFNLESHPWDSASNRHFPVYFKVRYPFIPCQPTLVAFNPMHTITAPGQQCRIVSATSELHYRITLN